uniref:Uncharacterized protein n=1 Tax=Tanacetum cinerariifolium TaxID=118510 RepID=A0A699I3X0_TANCI|nr:hypothetical protein [Tanacetum cinerariifolium]
MTDYSLWEVIKNGNKVLTRTDGTREEIYEPTTVEEKLDRRNEMKARGTLLMELPNKDHLKFHLYQDAKLLMEAIEKRAPKNQDNKGREYGRKIFLVKSPTKNALIAQDKIKGYDWSYQVEEEILTNYAFMALTSSGSSSSSETEVDSCSKSCMKAYANLKEQYDSLTLDYKKSQYNLLSYKTGLQSVKERLLHYKKNEAVLTDKINVLNFDVKLRDKVLADYTKNLEQAEIERDELKLTLEKLQNSSKALNNLLDSQVSDKSKAGLGYKEITPDSFVNSSKILEKQENRSDKEYHAVPPPLTGNYMPPKSDLRLIDEHFESVFVDVISNITPSDVKTVKTIDVNHKCVFSTEEPKPLT